MSPKQPISSPLASFGRQRCFCSSEPKAWMGYITSPPCTEAKLRRPESPRSSSCMMSPYATLLSPAQPYVSGRLAPRKPSAPISGISSVGKVPAR